MPPVRKRFGQHFLTNPRLLSRIADALELEPGDPVLEIGPGPGGLTAALVDRGARLTAIEIDRDLVPGLRARFPGVNLVEGNALETDWRSVTGTGPAGRLLVVGNIPYNITSPLIDKALTPPRPSRIVFLVQKEVADRVTARPGEPAYGALSVGVQSVARAECLFTVPAGAFRPRPKVDSALLRLTPLAEPLVSAAEQRSFRRLVVGLFGFRRKQLARGLRELTGWEASRVAGLLAGLGIRPEVRPEVLPAESFVALLRGLVDGGWVAR
jgi:16S rRNA (adenine1518-N6/adenine1519-N6)-dimethyltransferase